MCEILLFRFHASGREITNKRKLSEDVIALLRSDFPELILIDVSLESGLLHSLSQFSLLTLSAFSFLFDSVSHHSNAQQLRVFPIICSSFSRN